MNIYTVIGVLLIISFIWSVVSLQGFNGRKMKQVKQAQKTLAKGKIIFQKGHSR